MRRNAKKAATIFKKIHAGEYEVVAVGSALAWEMMR
jgi:hypothetical protein